MVGTSARPRSDVDSMWRLILQPRIVYGIVRVPVLWVGDRVDRRLRSLAAAAREFSPGADPEPIEERGPGDVRAVIAAHNLMRSRVTAMLDEKDQMLGAIEHNLRTSPAALRVRIATLWYEEDRARMADTIAEINGPLDVR